MINFTAQTLQVYKADISDALAKTKTLARAEKGAAAETVAATEKAGGAKRKLVEQIGILKEATGGQSTAMGKLAQSTYLLTAGFGPLGIAMIGVGAAMRALEPVMGAVTDGLKDMLGLSEDPRWARMRKEISDTRSEMQSLMTEIAALSASLLSPEDKVRKDLLKGAADVARATAELDGLRAEFLEKQAEYDRLVTERPDYWYLKSQEKSKEALHSATLVQKAELELEAAELRLAVAQKNRIDLETAGIEVHNDNVKALERVTRATGNATSAIDALNEAMRLTYESPIGAGLPFPVPDIDEEPSTLQLLGFQEDAVDRLLKPGPLKSKKSPFGAMGLPEPDELDQMIASAREAVKVFNPAAAALQSFSDAASNAFAALVDGTMTLKEALKSLVADFLGNMSKKLFAYGLELLITGQFARSGLAFGAAATLGLMAHEMGSSEKAPTASSGGGYGVGGGAAVTQPQYTTIFVGDGFLGQSNRQRSARLRHMLGAGAAGSYQG